MLEYYKDGQRDMSMCGFCVCLSGCKNTSLDEPRVPFITRACVHEWGGRMMGSGLGRGRGEG